MRFALSPRFAFDVFRILFDGRRVIFVDTERFRFDAATGQRESQQADQESEREDLNLKGSRSGYVCVASPGSPQFDKPRAWT